VASTLVVPTGAAVVEPRKTRRGVYELTYQPPAKVDSGAGRAAEVALVVPYASVQRAEKSSDTVTRVTVDLDAKLPPPHGDANADQPTDLNRSASSMINCDDPEIVALAAEATKAAKDGSVLARAEAARRFVHAYIQKKSLSVGFASASETARTKQGDCTEHGVLLAAILRAMKIPSRTVSGLVYAEQFLGHQGIIGYHMWAQAWVQDGTDGRWVDLDAVLDAEQPFDATHIALSYSAMADGEMFMDMLSMASLVGRLSIRVVESK
jgi:transglutaminase-like putative cysteine protease